MHRSGTFLWFCRPSRTSISISRVQMDPPDRRATVICLSWSWHLGGIISSFQRESPSRRTQALPLFLLFGCVYQDIISMCCFVFHLSLFEHNFVSELDLVKLPVALHPQPPPRGINVQTTTLNVIVALPFSGHTAAMTIITNWYPPTASPPRGHQAGWVCEGGAGAEEPPPPQADPAAGAVLQRRAGLHRHRAHVQGQPQGLPGL